MSEKKCSCEQVITVEIEMKIVCHYENAPNLILVDQPTCEEWSDGVNFKPIQNEAIILENEKKVCKANEGKGDNCKNNYKNEGQKIVNDKKNLS